jgi:uncharacterized protein YeaO (DUF488 family)
MFTMIIMIILTRIYDYHPPDTAAENNPRNDDGKNESTILVDRLWPRGVSKDRVRINIWMKDIAPSDKLRKWFAHDPKKWEQFRSRYKEEIMKDNNKIELLRQIKKIEKEKGSVILLYSAKDKEHNNAVALKEFLSESEI